MPHMQLINTISAIKVKKVATMIMHSATYYGF